MTFSTHSPSVKFQGHRSIDHSITDPKKREEAEAAFKPLDPQIDALRDEINIDYVQTLSGKEYVLVHGDIPNGDAFRRVNVVIPRERQGLLKGFQLEPLSDLFSAALSVAKIRQYADVKLPGSSIIKYMS